VVEVNATRVDVPGITTADSPYPSAVVAGDLPGNHRPSDRNRTVTPR